MLKAGGFPPNLHITKRDVLYSTVSGPMGTHCKSSIEFSSSQGEHCKNSDLSLRIESAKLVQRLREYTALYSVQ
jgi:hypothetical protein